MREVSIKNRDSENSTQQGALGTGNETALRKVPSGLGLIGNWD
jgi:hypothetical protein